MAAASIADLNCSSNLRVLRGPSSPLVLGAVHNPQGKPIAFWKMIFQLNGSAMLWDQGSSF